MQAVPAAAILPPKTIPRTPSTPLAFVRYVLRHCSLRMRLLALVGLSCQGLGAGLDVMVSWSFGRIAGAILESKNHDMTAVDHALVVLSILWAVRLAAFRSREVIDKIYVPELLERTRELLFARLVQQSQQFLHSNFAGVLANHVRRAGEIMSSLQEKLSNNIVPLIVRFATGGTLLWAITPKLTLLLFGFIILGIGCSLPMMGRYRKFAVDLAEKSSALTGYIVDSATNLSIVQQNTGWREEKRRLDIVQRAVSQSFSARWSFRSKFWTVFDMVMLPFFLIFFYLLLQAWQGGDVTTAQVAMTVGLVTNLFGALANTVDLISAKFDDIGVLHEALQKISTPLTVMDADNAPDLAVDKGMIEFRAVDFAYPGSRNVFENLNLTIPAGQKVGFVGVSGAGKTTLCQMLMRSYDIAAGGIYIDGQDIAQMTLDSLRGSIAVIPQEPVLFHRTLAENIRYGARDASIEDVKRAAGAAEASGFIESLPLGYDMLVGERGIKLSGGQRQRIAIARAILKRAPILLMDEATSALDSETEHAIQTAMLHAMEGRTTIVVAHRLSTLIRLDRIVVLDKGMVAEDGTFAQLIEKKGIFFRLWQMQAGGFLPEHL